jgi:CRP-like cAMP-binding protein
MLTIKPNVDKVLPGDIHWPCALSDAFKSEYAQQLSLATLQVGHLVGPESGALVYVLSGFMLLHWIPDDGRHTKGFVVGQGDWMGHSQLFESKFELMVSLDIVEPTTLALLPRNLAVTMFKDNNELYKLAYHVGLERWQSVLQVSHFNHHGDCRHNVAYVLLDACRRRSRVKGTIPVIRLSQQQIAMLTGFGRQRVNEELQYFAKREFIEIRRNAIALLNPDAVAECLNVSLLVMDDPRHLERYPVREQVPK